MAFVTVDKMIESACLELRLLTLSASLANCFSTSFRRASSDSRRHFLASLYLSTISDSVFSLRGLMFTLSCSKATLLTATVDPSSFIVVVSSRLPAVMSGSTCCCLIMKSVRTGSPLFFLFNPTSEPRLLLKMPLDRRWLAPLLSTMMAEWRELNGKKSEFSRRNPRKNELFIFESLSIRRWDLSLASSCFSVAVLLGRLLLLSWASSCLLSRTVVFCCCCCCCETVSAALGKLESCWNFEGKNRAKSQSFSNVASSISSELSFLSVRLAADCCVLYTHTHDFFSLKLGTCFIILFIIIISNRTKEKKNNWFLQWSAYTFWRFLFFFLVFAKIAIS